MPGTPTEFSRLLARSWVVPAPFQAGIFLSSGSFSYWQANKIKAPVLLEGSPVFAIMNAAPRAICTAPAPGNKKRELDR